MSHNEQKFHANLEHLSSLLEWVRSQLAYTLFSRREKKHVEIAVEEAVMNVIQHAYKNGPGEVFLICRRSDDQIEFELKDNGPPFNPLSYASSLDTAIPMEEREEGGLGLTIMLKCVDSLLYRREDDANVLTLIKKIV